jgi:hypothetical protein
VVTVAIGYYEITRKSLRVNGLGDPVDNYFTRPVIVVRLYMSVDQGNDFGEIPSILLLLVSFTNFYFEFFVCHDDIAVLSQG